MQVESRFHLQITGPEQGKKWVFLHGLMGYAQNWRGLIRQLESTERCLAFDQRGHGRSFQPESGYAPSDYAQDLHEILQELQWSKVILVGHSMGARNALEFALNHPESLSHLVLEDLGPKDEGHPEAEARQETSYFENLLGLVPTPFGSRTEAKRFFAEDFPTRAPTSEKSGVLAQFLFANLRENAKGEWDWQFAKPGIFESVESGQTFHRWAEMSQLSMPTLVIRGENSLALTKGAFDTMVAASPLIEGVEIPNAGHWVHFDQPTYMLDALRRFLGMSD